MGRRSIQLVCACALLAATTAAVQGQSPEDSAMAQHVAGSIKESGQLQNYSLGVKYQDGVAWLLGSVASKDQMEKAVELAQQVDGVEQVISKLEIQDDSSVVDAEIVDSKVQKASTSPASATSSSDSIRSSQQAMAQRMAQRPYGQRPMARPMTPGQQMPSQQMPSYQMQRRQMQNPAMARSGMPRPMMPARPGSVRPASYCGPGAGGGYGGGMGPQPQGHVPGGGAVGVSYDNAHMPGYAWPSYAAYPNYSALTYPKQYSASAWPYIGPFYPYPQVPLGWRKVCLEWDDGWWHLDFSHCKTQ